MNLQGLIFNGLKQQIKAQAGGIELSVVTKDLPLLIMSQISSTAQGKSQSDGYFLAGQLTLDYLSEFSNETEYVQTWNTVNSIIGSLHRQQTAISARVPRLKLTEISFDSFEQDILSEEEGVKHYSSVRMDFNFQVF